MSFLFGYLANQNDRTMCALTSDGQALTHDQLPPVVSWGLGFYQTGEILLRRTPVEQRTTLDLRDIVAGLRTDTAMTYFSDKPTTEGNPDNTSPFRLRQWLSVVAGDDEKLEPFRQEICEKIPDFLLRNTRGNSVHERLFTLMLTSIHDNSHLDAPDITPNTIAQALTYTMGTIASISEKKGIKPPSWLMMVTNQKSTVVASYGTPFSWLRRHGIRDCQFCRERARQVGKDPKRIDHEGLKYVLVRSGKYSQGDWVDVGTTNNGVLLTIDKNLEVQLREIPKS